MNSDEEALVRAFIAPEKRRRFLELLSNPRKRSTLLRELPHFRYLDARFAHRIPPRDQTADNIYRLLKVKGAPQLCHVLGMSELDGREVGLREALDLIVETSWGNFLSCLPGKLGYFGGEDPNERYILERC